MIYEARSECVLFSLFRKTLKHGTVNLLEVLSEILLIPRRVIFARMIPEREEIDQSTALCIEYRIDQQLQHSVPVVLPCSAEPACARHYGQALLGTRLPPPHLSHWLWGPVSKAGGLPQLFPCLKWQETS